jgi:hypothetical protein
VIRGPIQVIDVPGNHNSLLEEPHVRTLAQRVRTALDRALRNPELWGGTRAQSSSLLDANALDAE